MRTSSETLPRRARSAKVLVSPTSENPSASGRTTVKYRQPSVGLPRDGGSVDSTDGTTPWEMVGAGPGALRLRLAQRKSTQ